MVGVPATLTRVYSAVCVPCVCRVCVPCVCRVCVRVQCVQCQCVTCVGPFFFLRGRENIL